MKGEKRDYPKHCSKTTEEEEKSSEKKSFFGGQDQIIQEKCNAEAVRDAKFLLGKGIPWVSGGRKRIQSVMKFVGELTTQVVGKPVISALS